MNTNELLQRLDRLGNGPPSDEQAVLLQEARTRFMCVEVYVHTTEDLTGDDEVYVKVRRGGAEQTTGPVAIGDRGEHKFMIPLGKLAREFGAFTIEIFEKDTGFFDDDDQVIHARWEPPYWVQHFRGGSDVGGTYLATVGSAESF